MNSNTLYWLITAFVGLFMIFNEEFFAIKFEGVYPDNVYFGSFLIIISIIVLIIKSIIWYRKKSKENN